MNKAIRTAAMNRGIKPAQMQPEGILPGREPHGDEETYLYTGAGIRERHGNIPLWLALVAIGLLGWGVYYMIRYW
jgi:hypothetical protein